MWYSPVSLADSIKSIRFPHLPNPKISQAIKQFTNVNSCSCLRPPCWLGLMILIVCFGSGLSGYFPRGQTHSHFCLYLSQEAVPKTLPTISDLSPTSGQHYLGSVDVSSCPHWLDPLTQSGQEEKESGEAALSQRRGQLQGFQSLPELWQSPKNISENHQNLTSPWVCLLVFLECLLKTSP